MLSRSIIIQQIQRGENKSGHFVLIVNIPYQVLCHVYIVRSSLFGRDNQTRRLILRTFFLFVFILLCGCLPLIFILLYGFLSLIFILLCEYLPFFLVGTSLGIFFLKAERLFRSRFHLQEIKMQTAQPCEKGRSDDGYPQNNEEEDNQKCDDRLE